MPPTRPATFSTLVDSPVLAGAHFRKVDLGLSMGRAHFLDRTAERSLIDPQLLKTTSGLLPHEMVHSWNGKYRRPAGLATGNFDAPMKGDLLWVYEGLTTYLGSVLTALSGLWTALNAVAGS